jgi:hypothetical protein
VIIINNHMYALQVYITTVATSLVGTLRAPFASQFSRQLFARVLADIDNTFCVFVLPFRSCFDVRHSNFT